MSAPRCSLCGEIVDVVEDDDDQAEFYQTGLCFACRTQTALSQRFSYKPFPRAPREWRVTLRWTDGSSVRQCVPVQYWDYWPVGEVFEAAVDAHGISESHLIGVTMARYEYGRRVT